VPVGYCISRDQYFKRDDVGIIYQLNVLPTHQRGLIGAHLLQAVFDRAAYGCRLFCCWCAQDIAANRFWEAMGFVPLAFRAGSREKGRVHIFWQKRIRQGDETTPWWYPCKTDSGALREDRLVFPIPPGTHWSDAKPIVLPEATQPKQIEDAGAKQAGKKSPRAAVRRDEPLCGGLKFRPPAPVMPVVEEVERPKRQKIKVDPKYVMAARELRDRWLERVNSGQDVPAAIGKYDPTRCLLHVA
jgi:hypothetical protein